MLSYINITQIFKKYSVFIDLRINSFKINLLCICPLSLCKASYPKTFTPDHQTTHNTENQDWLFQRWSGPIHATSFFTVLLQYFKNSTALHALLSVYELLRDSRSLYQVQTLPPGFYNIGNVCNISLQLYMPFFLCFFYVCSLGRRPGN